MNQKVKDHKEGDNNYELIVESEKSSEEDDGSGEGEQTEDVIEELNINKLSNINIEKSNHSLDDKNIDVIDYRKTPVKILREIVKEKGLMSDPSKTKKQELLKLLQSEE